MCPVTAESQRFARYSTRTKKSITKAMTPRNGSLVITATVDSKEYQLDRDNLTLYAGQTVQFSCSLMNVQPSSAVMQFSLGDTDLTCTGSTTCSAYVTLDRDTKEVKVECTAGIWNKVVFLSIRFRKWTVLKHFSQFWIICLLFSVQLMWKKFTYGYRLISLTVVEHSTSVSLAKRENVNYPAAKLHCTWKPQ